MNDLTIWEMGVLKLLDQYGAPCDISGPRIGNTVKAAARECVRKGLISGSPKAYELTKAGRAALAPPTKQVS